MGANKSNSHSNRPNTKDNRGRTSSVVWVGIGDDLLRGRLAVFVDQMETHSCTRLSSSSFETALRRFDQCLLLAVLKHLLLCLCLLVFFRFGESKPKDHADPKTEKNPPKPLINWHDWENGAFFDEVEKAIIPPLTVGLADVRFEDYASPAMLSNPDLIKAL